MGAVGYALGVEGNPEPLGGELNPEVSQVPEGEEILELGELGAVGLSTAQVHSPACSSGRALASSILLGGGSKPWRTAIDVSFSCMLCPLLWVCH